MRLRVISVDRGVGSIWEGGRIHYISSLAVMYIHIPTPHLSPSPPPPCHTYAKIVQTMYTFLMLLLSHRYYTRSSVMLSKSQLILFGKDNSTQVKIFASIWGLKFRQKNLFHGPRANSGCTCSLYTNFVTSVGDFGSSILEKRHSFYAADLLAQSDLTPNSKPTVLLQ
jgi:hypothetical protein